MVRVLQLRRMHLLRLLLRLLWLGLMLGLQVVFLAFHLASQDGIGLDHLQECVSVLFEFKGVDRAGLDHLHQPQSFGKLDHECAASCYQPLTTCIHHLHPSQGVLSFGLNKATGVIHHHLYTSTSAL